MKGLLAVIFIGLMVLLLPACGSSRSVSPDAGWDGDGDIIPPDFWDPGDDQSDPCGYGYGGECDPSGVDCQQDPCVHGRCVEGYESPDRCECDEGYTGQMCDVCAEGYVPSGLDCLPAGGCVDSPCMHGTCRPRPEGEFVCDCEEGYAGSLCDECADGYHIEDLKCVPD